MAEITLNDMESFDFKEPLNETIIYDDCEEDERSIIPKIEIETNLNDNNIEINGDIEYQCSINFEIHEEHTPVDNAELMQNSNVQLKDTQNNNGNQNVRKRYETENTSLSDETVYHNSITKTKQGKRSSSEIGERVDANHKKTKNHDKYIAENMNDILQKNNATTMEIKSPLRNQEPHVNENTDRSIICKFPTNFNTDKCNINSERRVEIVADHEELNYNNTLETISHNLIRTVQAYHDHLNIVMNKNNSNEAMQHSKKRFIYLKTQYYQLSYYTVENIILLQDCINKRDFSEEFLNKTLKYAKEKLNVICSKEDVAPFYDELIAWVKRKKYMLQKGNNHSMTQENGELNNKQSNVKATPLLSMQLAQPPMLPKCPNIQRLTNTMSVPNTAISNGHATPNEEFARSPVLAGFLNLLPKYPTLPNVPRSDYVYSHLSRPPPPYEKNLHRHMGKPPEVSGFTNMSSNPVLPEYPNYMPTTPIFTGGDPNREVVISVDAATLKMNNSINRSPQISRRLESTKEYRFHNQFQGNYNYQPSNVASVASNFQESNQYKSNTRIYSHSSLENVASNTINNTHQYNYHVDPQRQYYDYHYQMPNMKQPTQPISCNTYSPHVQLQQYTEQEKNSQIVLQRDQNRQNETLSRSLESTRSSVSTDSGFASPLQFNSPTEGMTLPEEGPLITHVTSLNPNATQIVEGSCHVCAARTKKKCLGCLHFYYCTTACQSLDWSKHKGFCRTVQEKTKDFINMGSHSVAENQSEKTSFLY